MSSYEIGLLAFFIILSIISMIWGIVSDIMVHYYRQELEQYRSLRGELPKTAKYRENKK
jgi:hypothetical protein